MWITAAVKVVQIKTLYHYLFSQHMSRRIDLFCVLETQKTVDQSITALFMEAVMESIHQMVRMELIMPILLFNTANQNFKESNRYSSRSGKVVPWHV